MNRKTLYLNLLATTLLLGAGAAQAERSMPLAEAVRWQMHEASARIQLDIAATLKAQPLVLDVHGVEIGELEVIETSAENVRPEARPATGSNISAAVEHDLITKALEAPGLFGVYRYMAASALTVAIVVAE